MLALCLAAAVTAGSQNVRDFGAVGDGVHNDTKAIQQAIDAGGTVVDYDFVKAMAGVPEGVKLRQNAEIMVYGLRTLDWFDKQKPGGCTIGRVALPGAFELKCVFMVDMEKPVDRDGNQIKGRAVVWDDKYVAGGSAGHHRGMQLSFEIVGDTWTPQVAVGLGEGSYTAKGPSRKMTPGDVVSLVLRYYGDKRVDWDFGGLRAESALPLSGTIAAGEHQVVIGDRVGSLHMPFRGAIQRITVTPMKRQPFALSLSGRLAFERGEKDASVKLSVENIAGRDAQTLGISVAQFDIDGRAVGETRQLKATALANRETASFEIPVETRVRPGWQRLKVEARTSDGLVATGELKFGIGPLFADRMTALMWQGNSKEIAEMGLTHVMVRFGLSVPMAEGGDPASGLARLDEALVDGVRFADGSNVIFFPKNENKEKYYRRHRDGSTGRGHTVPCEVDNPELIARAREIHTDNAKAFGPHPAFEGVLNCSEWREWSFPSFNQDHLRYRRETGREVPEEVSGSRFDSEKAKKRYPDGVVPDDDEILAFYRWFWSGGDGWGEYFKACAEPYRQHVKHPFFSWWDPAVRCPPRYGSGEGVDRLNQWVYAYPDPINVAGPCEDLLTMCEGGGQTPMIMTQVITYRSQIAPKNEKVVPEPDWVKRRPNAMFPSIPPDSLQEATWAMLAKPVQAIAYHGWGCIRETGEDRGYVYTNPETEAMMKRIQREVVQPLGPMLKKLGREKSEVAVLESFTSVVNGSPWSSGYRQTPVTFLQAARLDPRVVYEETLEKEGFGGLKVLYAAACPYLTASMVNRLKEFRRGGGILIGDPLLVKAVEADFRTPLMQLKSAPAADQPEDVEAYERENRKLMSEGPRAFTRQQKADMQAAVEELRRALEAKYRPKFDSSSPDLYTFARRWQEVDYLFVINDRRDFGDYVGQWGRTMEKGLAMSGWASVRDEKRRIGAVYELSRGGEARFVREGGLVKVPLEYTTNDGRLLAFLPERIKGLEVRASESVVPGGTIVCGYRIVGESGNRIAALLPGEIRVYDAAGRELDGAGFVAAVDGVAKLAVRTNVNDAPGDYRLVCRDRASGLEVAKTISQAPRQ